jgi:Tfp pilus assembly protein PilO
MSKETTSHDTIIIINQKKKEVGIFISITLVVLIILILFPIRLMALSVIKINNEIEGKRKIKEQLDNKIRNFSQLNVEYQEIRDDLKDFSLIFPNEGDYSLFVANLEEICKANYFRLESVNVTSARSSRQVGENPFDSLNIWTTNISVLGRRSDLLRLLEDIEAMPMHPTVSVVSYKNELNNDGFLSFSISIKMYGVNKPGIYLDI